MSQGSAKPEQDLAKLIDDFTSADYLYVCLAPIGTATSASAWKISRMENSTGLITWADGNNSFDNVADNRASLTYS